MKYLKTFENIKQKYKIGDYVKIHLISEDFKGADIIDVAIDFNKTTAKDNAFKIIDMSIKNHKKIYTVYFGDTSKEIDDSITLDITEDDILRLATQDEIDIYDSKINANKYNI